MLAEYDVATWLMRLKRVIYWPLVAQQIHTTVIMNFDLLTQNSTYTSASGSLYVPVIWVLYRYTADRMYASVLHAVGVGKNCISNFYCCSCCMMFICICLFKCT